MSNLASAREPASSYVPGSKLVRSGWILVALLTAVIAGAYAYYKMFSLFQGYDDEGYVLISLKCFLKGKPLYDEVYSSFQPGFYFLSWIFFGTTGAPVCHDTIRLLTLLFWLGGAGLNGLICFRLSSSALLTLLVSVISVKCMAPFVNEPGHPESLLYLLVVAIVALLAFAEAFPRWLLSLTVGGLAALMLLIKINIGLFIVLPLIFCFAVPRSPNLSRWIRLAAGLIMLILPALLWRVQLSAKNTPLALLVLFELFGGALLLTRVLWSRGIVWIVAALFCICLIGLLAMNSMQVAALPVCSAALLSLSICGTLMVCFDRFSGNEVERFSPGVACLAGAGLVVVVLVFTVLRGTSLAGLLNGLVWWPAKISAIFVIRPRSNWAGISLGLAGSVTAFGYLAARGFYGGRAWFRWIVVSGQFLFGFSVLCEFYLPVEGSSPLMPLADFLPHFWMLPFAWLAAASEPKAESTIGARAPLLVVAVMQPLIAIPVAGTQLVPASMLIPVLGAVCLTNAIRAVANPVTNTQVHPWLRLSALGCGVVLFLMPFVTDTLELRRQYAALTPLDLPGAHRLRLNQDQVQVYHQIVEQLSRPDVDTFLSLPVMNSFYLWSLKDPPTCFGIGSWIVLFDDPQQELVWDSAKNKNGLRIVRNRRLVRSWVKGRSIQQLPLVRHIEDNFKLLATYGDYEVLVRR
jgi:hypothetical protein